MATRNKSQGEQYEKEGADIATFKINMPVETLCNHKCDKVLSVKYEEVEIDKEDLKPICVLLIKRYLRSQSGKGKEVI